MRCILIVHSRETEDSWCHSHKVTQYMKQTARYLIVFGCLYPSCCKGSSYQNIKKESYDLSSLTLCFV